MKKGISIILFLLMSLPIVSFADELMLCLNSKEGNITLTLKLFGSDWKKGISHYCGQSSTMKLNQKKYYTLKSYKDHPSVFLIQWDEYWSGKKTGYYSVELQGSNFYNAYYFNYRTKKKTTFNIQTSNSVEECSCN